MANSKSDDPEAVKGFLDELTSLSRRHGIAIGGCGCCSSPFLLDVKSEDCFYRMNPREEEHLEWVDPASI